MQPAQRVALNTGFLYAKMAITVFISLYATRIILLALGVEDFGIFNVVGGAITMLTFLNNAMSSATQRFMSYSRGSENEQRQKQIFNVSIVLHIFIAIILFIILQVAGYYLFNGILNISEHRMGAAKLIYQFMIVSTMFSVISVPYDAVINAHENMLLVAILGIIEAVIRLGIAIYIVNLNVDKLVIFGVLTAALAVLLMSLRRLYCHRFYTECDLNIKKYFTKPLFKEISSFAGWSFLGTSSSMLTNYGQGIVLNIFFGTIVNAAQGIANQISGQLGVFAGTMLKALHPMIAKSEGAGNRELMLKASMVGSKLSFFLMMLFYIPVLIEMPLILKYWLNEVPKYTVIFCSLLLIRNLIEQLYYTLSLSIAAVGNIRKYQIYGSILNIFPLIISYLLFKINYSPYVIYIVFLVYSIFSAAITFYFSKTDCGLSLPHYFKNVIYPCIISFIITISISYIPLFFISDGILRLILVLTLSVITFFITVWSIGLNVIERNEIGKMIITVLEKIALKTHLVKGLASERIQLTDKP